MHKKTPKICTGCRVSAAKIYLYHSTECCPIFFESDFISSNVRLNNYIKPMHWLIYPMKRFTVNFLEWI